jgi:hypothetical protein
MLRCERNIKILIGKSGGKIQLIRRRSEDNIKIEPRVLGRGSASWIEVAEVTVQRSI